MKLVRWAAAAAVTLMSLMNLGAGTDSKTTDAVVVIGIVAGVAGLVAVFGLVRRLSWGVPAALGVSAVNLVLGVIGAVEGWNGAAVGITVGAVGLVLTFLASSSALGHSRTASTA
jgi:hypothetical protein